jgi:ferritin-like metal-binding protein YciE
MSNDIENLIEAAKQVGMHEERTRVLGILSDHEFFQHARDKGLAGVFYELLRDEYAGDKEVYEMLDKVLVTLFPDE